MTVVWSRPPKCWPILGSDRSVSSRHRYIAICRAVTRTLDRDVPHRSSIDSPKYDAVWPMIVAAAVFGPLASGIKAFRAHPARRRPTGSLVMPAKAPPHRAAPSNPPPRAEYALHIDP